MSEVVAPRGERLALARWLWSGTGEDFGPSEIEFLEHLDRARARFEALRG
jgi:hypothetical protein